MKKVAGILVVAALGIPLLSMSEATPSLQEELAQALLVNQDGSIADSTTDVVKIEGKHIDIITEDVAFEIDLPAGYICFTQDIFASADLYMRYTTFHEYIMKDDIHAYIYYPQEPYSRFYFTVAPEHYFSKRIGELSEATEDQIISFGKAYGKTNGLEYSELVITEHNVWVSFGHKLVTITGGRFVEAVWGSDEEEMGVDSEEIRMLLENVIVKEA